MGGHGIYCGPLDYLRGQGALVRSTNDPVWSNEKEEIILVQFDNTGLGELAFGWHAFKKSEFEILEYGENNE